jgi:hypothetical protein
MRIYQTRDQQLVAGRDDLRICGYLHSGRSDLTNQIIDDEYICGFAAVLACIK